MKSPAASCMFAAICLLGLFAYGEGCPQKMKEFFVGKDKVVLKVEYQGCFLGEAHFSATDYEQMKISLCNTPCYTTGFTYMALIGTKCFCETKINNDEKVDDSKCQTPCPGNNKEKCGGEGAYSVYTTAPNYKEE